MSIAFQWLPGWQQEPLTTAPIRVIGIDLGTTNSTVTEIVWDPTSGEEPRAQILDIAQKTPLGELTRDLVPSVVALVDGVEYIGEGAHRLRAAVVHPLTRGKNVWSETKNDIGTRRQYASAPDGYRTPRDIAEKILRFLLEGATDASPLPIDRVVITVPASFQLTQRQDTIDAAIAAGITLHGQDLFDEPVAAFLDHFTQSKGAILTGRDQARVMVVDFGGGTCDVALIEAKRASDGTLDVSRHGVSRFHRIGGSDIDDAIAVDILLPKLLEENGLGKFAFNYKQKRDFVIPGLAALAETLKKKLSDLAQHRRALGTFNAEDPSLSVTLPVPYTVATGSPVIGTLTLASPSLTLQEWRRATSRFTNPNLIAPVQNEYVQVTSMFAPIRDVLQRAEWAPMHVDYVLLVGGASLDFGVAESLEKQFPDSVLLTYKDPLDAQRCVGRGAAYQALLLAAFGNSPLRATIGEAVQVRTTAGPQTVIPANTPLPFPSNGGWHEVSGLAMSESASANGYVDVRGEFLSGSRVLYTNFFRVPGPVSKGAPIRTMIRVDDNQRLQIKLTVIAESGEHDFDVDLDNPFSVTANPNADRDRILEIEEQLATANPETQAKLMWELAQLHFRIKEYERARQLLEGLYASGQYRHPVQLLHMLGLICGEMHDDEAQIEYYKEAIRLGSDDGPAFNLALKFRQDKQAAPGLELAEASVAKHPKLEWHSLHGGLLSDLQRDAEAQAAWQRAVDLAGDLTKRSDFELGWLRAAASGLADRELEKAIDDERESRKKQAKETGFPDDRADAVLPDWNA